MRIKNFIKKYYASVMLISFVLTIAWGIVKTVSNNQAFARDFLQSKTLNIVHMSDIHYDSSSKSNSGRMFGDSSRLLEDAIKQLKVINDPYLVVFSGDLINRPVKKDLVKFLKLVAKIKSPWYVSLGNHDISVSGRLTKAKFMDTVKKYNSYIKSKLPYYAIMFDENYLIVFMDGVIVNRITARGRFSKEQLKWLDKQLETYSSKKVIIVQHFPIVEPYRSKSHAVENAQDYLDVLDKHDNVLAVLAGHYHCAKIKKRNKVLHITTPSLIQYPNSFRVVSFIEQKDKIKVVSQIYSTTLDKVREESKKGVKFAAPLLNGLPSDRNSVFYLSK